MTLSCWIHCAGCGLRIPICRELKPHRRYHTTCKRCGARIGFGLEEPQVELRTEPTQIGPVSLTAPSH
jgi:hypothetical protein